jgi:hypothetical protein
MDLKQVMTALDYKITGGSEYLWQCYPNARDLDFESDYATASIVFNSQTQEVYCAEVNDKKDKLPAYRWLNPDYKDAYKNECVEKNTEFNLAWDDKKWTDLEVSDDWCAKANAIMNGLMFDTRIVVPLDLSDTELFQLMKLAHERDVTLNKMVEMVITNVINDYKSTI